MNFTSHFFSKGSPLLSFWGPTSLRTLHDYMIVVLLAYLWPCALDTQVKGGAQQTSDHHLVRKWISWQWEILDRPGRLKRMMRVSSEMAIFSKALYPMGCRGICRYVGIAEAATWSYGCKTAGHGSHSKLAGQHQR